MSVLAALVAVVAIVIAAVVVLRNGAPVAPPASPGTAPEEPGEDGGVQTAPIDPALILYRPAMMIPVAMEAVHALAVGPEDRIYVGGGRAVHVFDAQGARQKQIALEEEPSCLAVAGADQAHAGRVYVGTRKRVHVLDAEGTGRSAWEPLGEKALVTSIATADEDVFIADAGNRIVWHYDTSGKLLGRIGARDDARKIPGFVITSPYFDLVMGKDGLLRVVNPRALRIEAYTARGDLELAWGKPAPTIDGFFGCCNPAHLAVLPDGRIVTAEKGIPRVKVYSADGKFQCVVAGPPGVAAIADLAADSRGRVLVLDASAKAVRIFEAKSGG